MGMRSPSATTIRPLLARPCLVVTTVWIPRKRAESVTDVLDKTESAIPAPIGPVVVRGGVSLVKTRSNAPT